VQFEACILEFTQQTQKLSISCITCQRWSYHITHTVTQLDPWSCFSGCSHPLMQPSAASAMQRIFPYSCGSGV